MSELIARYHIDSFHDYNGRAPYPLRCSRTSSLIVRHSIPQQRSLINKDYDRQVAEPGTEGNDYFGYESAARFCRENPTRDCALRF